jgi:predicted transcriptional regulator
VCWVIIAEDNKYLGVITEKNILDKVVKTQKDLIKSIWKDAVWVKNFMAI